MCWCIYTSSSIMFLWYVWLKSHDITLYHPLYHHWITIKNHEINMKSLNPIKHMYLNSTKSPFFIITSHEQHGKKTIIRCAEAPPYPSSWPPVRASWAWTWATTAWDRRLGLAGDGRYHDLPGENGDSQKWWFTYRKWGFTWGKWRFTYRENGG